MNDARKAALDVLEKCRRSGAWSDAVLGGTMEKAQLSGADRGFAAALSYGVIQNRMLLDHVIETHASIPLRRIEPKVLDILRLTVDQILFMDRVPPSAAVNSAVALTKELGFARASAFVNAILRKISSESCLLPESDDPQSLSIRWSHPLWLTELYISLLGTEEAKQLLQSDNSPAAITLQTNTLRISTDALLSELKTQGLQCQPHPFLPDAICLDRCAVQELPSFCSGAFYVQDAAAKLAVMAAAPAKELRILDVCAAPGGTTFAASILSGGAEIIACDIHENKLRRIREGAERLGLENISLKAMDARIFVPEFADRFDLVIADIPCSGLGVIRKKPDIRYKNPKEFEALPEIQSAILQNVSRYVKPGGTLLYSTCTIRPEENDGVCEAFLKNNTVFSAEDFTLPDGIVSRRGMLQLWPQRNGTDGFFIARMRKWK